MQDVYQPNLQRIIPYMFCIGIVGIFMLVVMRKRFIIDYRLHFPSGTATGILISGFHTPKGEAQARAQVGFSIDWLVCIACRLICGITLRS